MPWWHYTLGTKLVSIIADEHIKRASAGVSRDERKAVWFSARNEWEPSATKGVIDPTTGQRRNATLDEMVAAGGALVRLEASHDVARGTWAQHLQYIDPRIGDALERSARAVGGDPAEWRGSYRDVPVAEVLQIEASVDGKEWHFVGSPGSADGRFELDAEFVDVVREVLEKQGSELTSVFEKDEEE